MRIADKGDVRAAVVISDAGVFNTFTRLLPRAAGEAFCAHILRDLEDGGVIAPATPHVTLFVGLNGDATTLGLPSANYWVRVRVRVRARVHVRVRASVHERVRASVHVRVCICACVCMRGGGLISFHST